MNEDRSEGKSEDESNITMKELMMANIQQQKLLSKIMDKYDSNRFACIEKYFGRAFIYSQIHFFRVYKLWFPFMWTDLYETLTL